MQHVHKSGALCTVLPFGCTSLITATNFIGSQTTSNIQSRHQGSRTPSDKRICKILTAPTSRKRSTATSLGLKRRAQKIVSSSRMQDWMPYRHRRSREHDRRGAAWNPKSELAKCSTSYCPYGEWVTSPLSACSQDAYGIEKRSAKQASWSWKELPDWQDAGYHQRGREPWNRLNK